MSDTIFRNAPGGSLHVMLPLPLKRGGSPTNQAITSAEMPFKSAMAADRHVFLALFVPNYRYGSFPEFELNSVTEKDSMGTYHRGQNDHKRNISKIRFGSE